MLELFLDKYNYWIVIALMLFGLYIVIARGNLVKKLVGLNVFQTSVFMFYISLGKAEGGTAPILTGKPELFSNPLPHVLILTAIVVGIATTALGLALVVRIRESYDSIEEDELDGMDNNVVTNERARLSAGDAAR
ncbi:cation:proton antiporter subunit C [uncultured Nisaea sp.]|jgi:multicomponent Na+:H+ antiporter subunit C|uniref:cation:proton antiporter subunit C n=1 Tax=uncultured Nisaea sp. TaxID=538215 RepID=UPI0030EE37D3|tara:strand:+ start:2279 stop:2683 length:405 start_codon:yes stop_codon:yes gene_type:complete